MSSEDFFIPCPRGLTVPCYELLLLKIHGRILSLGQGSVSKGQMLLRGQMLRRSLDDWYSAIPDSLKNVPAEIQAEPTGITDPRTTWHHAFIMVMYHCVCIDLSKPAFLNNIQEDLGLATSSTATREVFISGIACSNIIQAFLKNNPSFQFVPPFIHVCIFGVGLMLLLLSRMQINHNDVSLAEIGFRSMHLALGQYSLGFQLCGPQKALLDRFMNCNDPVLLVLAIKSLKNLKGETKTTVPTDILVADDASEEEEGETSVNAPLHQQASSLPTSLSYNDPSFLESVASMSTPYADLMMGNVGVKFELDSFFPTTS